MPGHFMKRRQAMFKSLIAFCLSRRPIVVVGVLLFVGAGLHCF